MDKVQERIVPGQHWVRDYNGVLIFGRCMSPDEIKVNEMALGADEAEAQYTAVRYSELFDNGLMFGKCYSVIEKEGEYGTTHKGTVWPISPQAFEAAQRAEWTLGLISDAEREREIMDALARLRVSAS